MSIGPLVVKPVVSEFMFIDIFEKSD